MKELIAHLLRENAPEVLSMSLKNCHAKGVHSIMLSNSPERTIRLFVAEDNHSIYRNTSDYKNGQDLSVAFHPHHMNITLHCVKGSITNWVAEIINDGSLEKGDMTYKKWRYHSQIKEGQMGFEYIGSDVLRTVVKHVMTEGSTSYMDAKDIHTVYCERGKVAAWFVYQGKEDSTYDSVCWSNTALDKESSDGLYEKPTSEEIRYWLMLADLCPWAKPIWDEIVK